jgi:hypothetical protein
MGSLLTGHLYFKRPPAPRHTLTFSIALISHGSQ